MPNEKTAEIHETKILHRGQIFSMVSESLTLPTGKKARFDLIRHPGAAVIVPVTADGKVLLLRQYRHALRKYIWEIPAGTLDPDESPLECAKRELIEETGFSAKHMEVLGSLFPVPGYCDEKLTLFLATDLTPSAQHLDPDEVLVVHKITWPEALEMAYDGRIKDAKTVVGLLWADGRLKASGQDAPFS